MEELKKARKVRKKSPSRNKTKQAPKPEHSARMKAWWAGPGGEAHRAKQAANPERFWRRGVPDGMRKPEANRLWAVAREKARMAIEVLEERGDLPTIVVPGSDEEKGKLALEEAMVMALSPLTNAQTKLQALRTVLEWTKSKPVQKTAVALGSAEEWLKEVIEDGANKRPPTIEGDTKALP